MKAKILESIVNNQGGPKNRIKAILLFLRIVWRKWDRFEIAPGEWKTIRLDPKTAWEVAKLIHLKGGDQ